MVLKRGCSRNHSRSQCAGVLDESRSINLGDQHVIERMIFDWSKAVFFDETDYLYCGGTAGNCSADVHTGDTWQLTVVMKWQSLDWRLNLAFYISFAISRVDTWQRNQQLKEVFKGIIRLKWDSKYCSCTDLYCKNTVHLSKCLTFTVRFIQSFFSANMLP